MDGIINNKWTWQPAAISPIIIERATQCTGGNFTDYLHVTRSLGEARYWPQPRLVRGTERFVHTT